jgi:hypothetical protein
MRSMSIEACTCASKFHNYRIRGIIKLAFSKILDIEKFHKIYSNKIQKGSSYPRSGYRCRLGVCASLNLEGFGNIG